MRAVISTFPITVQPNSALQSAEILQCQRFHITFELQGHSRSIVIRQKHEIG